MSEEKKQKIEITVDNKGTEELVKILKEKEEKEQREEKEKKVDADLDDLASMKIQAYKKFGRPEFLEAFDKITLVKMIDNYIEGLTYRAPSGSAPLNPQQMGQKEENLYEKKYGSQYEMVNDLISKSHGGNEEAQSYLNSLMRQYVFSKKRNLSAPEGFYDPNSPEALQQLDLVQKDGFLTPRDPKDGDIGRIMENFRKERMLRMKKGSETQ